MSGSDSDTKVLRIAVGTKNPCKIDAVTEAIKQSIQSATESQVEVGIHVQGFPVESGVADQPFGDKETIQGAKNRAVRAYHAYQKENNEFPHLSVGLEGGLEWSSLVLDPNGEQTLWCMAWMALYGKRNALLADALASSETGSWEADEKPIISLAKTGSFLLPPAMGDLIKQGMELGDADDQISGRTKSKHGSGTVGYLTAGMIGRSAYYVHALILALVPWIRPDMYSPNGFPNLAE
eukprot:CAMPEP_0116147570 /NCGR_PEP_ID=MMETSP0329-20121206/17826_1 /TAXON_ID=697910 /ORGANISM="Pseudo-nitzschia arenysensis, Strain B593" /LENGTH=236 /DNA_ID=CAMNT_0003643509 /DNA_START=18 /DNA_END=728 /DNA_ORIENTATION=+